MAVRRSEATWEGDLMEGSGRMRLGSGAFEGKYTFRTRLDNEPGTNPEELLGAAHAGCFSMALAAALGKAGHPPRRIHATADVHLDKAGDSFKISRIALHTEGDVPGIDEETFRRFATEAEKNCIISRALGGTIIEMEAKLVR